MTVARNEYGGSDNSDKSDNEFWSVVDPFAEEARKFESSIMGISLDFMLTQEMTNHVLALVHSGDDVNNAMRNLLEIGTCIDKLYTPEHTWNAYNLADGSALPFNRMHELPVVNPFAEPVFAPDAEGVPVQYHYGRVIVTKPVLREVEAFAEFNNCTQDVAINALARRAGPVVELTRAGGFIVVNGPETAARDIVMAEKGYENRAIILAEQIRARDN